MEDLSETELIEVENKILSTLKSYKTEYVPIESKFETEVKLWTISLNTESQNTPLVLLHGFAAGLGFWLLNFETLSKNRPLYAMDLLGFGRSSRPEFNEDGDKVEEEMVEAIEAWRKQMKLEKMILLGHSMGAFLATVYSMKYPDRVQHLILADHWGFTDKYDNPPLFIKILVYLFHSFNPLGCLRYLGPYYGPLLLQKTRRDIFGNFGEKMNDGFILPSYIFHCNNILPPTGEKAFYRMILGIGWAKNPIIKRIDKLKNDIPMTIMYGSRTWMDSDIGERMKKLRPNSYIDIHTIENSGHHIYSEQADCFNDIVLKACEFVDSQKNKKKLTESRL